MTRPKSPQPNKDDIIDLVALEFIRAQEKWVKHGYNPLGAPKDGLSDEERALVSYVNGLKDSVRDYDEVVLALKNNWSSGHNSITDFAIKAAAAEVTRRVRVDNSRAAATLRKDPAALNDAMTLALESHMQAAIEAPRVEDLKEKFARTTTQFAGRGLDSPPSSSTEDPSVKPRSQDIEIDRVPNVLR